MYACPKRTSSATQEMASGGHECLDNGRHTVAAGCVGTAQGCYDVAKKYALESPVRKPIAAISSFRSILQKWPSISMRALIGLQGGPLENKGVRCTREVSKAALLQRDG